MDKPDIEKFCLSCKKPGHTYLECPGVNFFDMLGATLGVPNLVTGESAQELQDRVSGELEEISREQSFQS
jgi:hypothetical protein